MIKIMMVKKQFLQQQQYHSRVTTQQLISRPFKKDNLQLYRSRSITGLTVVLLTTPDQCSSQLGQVQGHSWGGCLPPACPTRVAAWEVPLPALLLQPPQRGHKVKRCCSLGMLTHPRGTRQSQTQVKWLTSLSTISQSAIKNSWKYINLFRGSSWY